MSSNAKTVSRDIGAAVCTASRQKGLRTRFVARTAVLVALMGFLSTTTFASGTWTTKAPLLTGRSQHVVAESNGILYAVGGFVTATDASVLVEAYDPAANEWSTRAPALTPRVAASGAFLNGILYVVGGHPGTGAPMATVEAYDPATDKWTAKRSMLATRYGAGIAVVDGILYVMGGIGLNADLSRNCDALLKTVEAYDPATDLWTAKASMLTARVYSAAAAVGGVVYAVGGEGCPSGSFVPGAYLANTEAYDPVTNRWTERASMSTVRATHGVAALDGFVYALGGQTANPSGTLATVEAYDPVANQWTSRSSMLTARYALGVAVANGALYAVGGAQGNALTLATTEVLKSNSNRNPVADAGPNQTVNAASADGVEVTLDGTGSSDADGDAVAFKWSAPSGIVLDPTSATPAATFPVGMHLVTLTVSDGHGGLDTDDVMIQVEPVEVPPGDTEPPQVACTTDFAALWPPNHEIVEVEVRIVASDTVSEPAELVLLSVTVTSDESDDATGNGDGSTTGDVNGADGFADAVDATASFAFDASGAFVGTVELRAERSASGDGRSYGIQAVIEDASGNSTSATCVVVVPHSRGR